MSPRPRVGNVDGKSPHIWDAVSITAGTRWDDIKEDYSTLGSR
ncbi:MAG: hypothetical protein WBZ36_29920 [Candidatus Nitrosopolaris sp.]